MDRDPLVDEVRETRREISRECGHDIWKLYARYKAAQEQMKADGTGQFVSQPLVARTQDISAPGRAR